MKGSHRVTTAKLKKILKLYEKGYCFIHIAKITGMSKAGIMYLINEFQLREKKSKKLKDIVNEK